MTSASIVELYTAPAMSQAMVSRDEILAVAGRGIEGDRYLLETGTYSKKPELGRQLTMIAAEMLDAMASAGFAISASQCRRNVVTRGIELEPLVGTELRLGDTRLRVHRKSTPCRYLENLLDMPGLCDAWWDKCGINCEILVGGRIWLGAPVTVA